MGNKFNEICYIGICGATRSGKTTLAENILKYFNAPIEKLINLDEYYSLEKIWENNNNWEIPESLEWEYLIKDLNDPKYLIKYKDKNYIIVEGFLLFKKPLCHIFNRSIFVYITKKECKKRRMISKPVPEEYFEYLIWPNYIKYNYHLAEWKKNKEKNIGEDLLILDSISLSKEEMMNISLKYILGEKIEDRNINKEQELMNKIENEYISLFNISNK